MGGLLDLINGDSEPDEVLRRYRESQQRETDRQMVSFRALGAQADDPCPATTVYHDRSRLAHDTPLPIGPAEIRSLTRDLDYKRYPDAFRVALPAPSVTGDLCRALASRRSAREFGPDPVPGSVLATCLGAGCGVTRPDRTPPGRAAPSAGALFPIEIYASCFDVVGVEPGLYHYDVLGHALELVRSVRGSEDLWPVLCQGFWGARPGLALLFSARLSRSRRKYGERAYRFALIEVGHLAQNVCLLATAAGATSTPVGGFVDHEMSRWLGIDGRDEVALYAVLIGTELIGRGMAIGDDGASTLLPEVETQGTATRSGRNRTCHEVERPTNPAPLGEPAIPAGSPANRDLWRGGTGRESQDEFRPQQERCRISQPLKGAYSWQFPES